MSFLPNDEEREWLGRSLRDIIKKRGLAQFACAPLLTPSDDDFPDPWDGSVRAAHRLTQRLMQHAGISNLNNSSRWDICHRRRCRGCWLCRPVRVTIETNVPR